MLSIPRVSKDCGTTGDKITIVLIVVPYSMRDGWLEEWLEGILMSP
jgi:hypothetical protein